jgi:hypothetical protein
MARYEEMLVPLEDDELARHISIILAAHSNKFPQLRGKAVPPDHRDVARRRFAQELVSRLRQGRVVFFRMNEDDLVHNSKWFGENKR